MNEPVSYTGWIACYRAVCFRKSVIQIKAYEIWIKCSRHRGKSHWCNIIVLHVFIVMGYICWLHKTFWGQPEAQKCIGIKILAFKPFYDYILTIPLWQENAFFSPDLDSTSRFTSPTADFWWEAFLCRLVMVSRLTSTNRAGFRLHHTPTLTARSKRG